MTADTITLDSLRKTEALLDDAAYKIHRARLEALSGDITTERAAEIVNEVAAAIALSAR